MLARPPDRTRNPVDSPPAESSRIDSHTQKAGREREREERETRERSCSEAGRDRERERERERDEREILRSSGSSLLPLPATHHIPRLRLDCATSLPDLSSFSTEATGSLPCLYPASPVHIRPNLLTTTTSQPSFRCSSPGMHGSSTIVLSPTTKESLTLTIPPLQADGSMANRDTAQVIHSPRLAHATRRSLSNKRMAEKTGLSPDSAAQSNKDVSSESFSCTSPKPSFLISLPRMVSSFLSCKTSFRRHFLYYTFGTAILFIVILRLLLVDRFTLNDFPTFSSSLVFSHPQRRNLQAVRDIFRAVDSAGSSILLKGNEEVIDRSPEESKLWESPRSEGLKQCIRYSTFYKEPKATPNGYIMVNANGGLNQMRNGICDMVAIARILNAAFVLPRLDHTSFWSDPSEFADIYDVQHFVKVLQKDVQIVESLPASLNGVEPFIKAPVSWSKASYYKTEILPILRKHKVINFTHSDSRLANNDLPSSIQKLRCRTCYRALKYTEPLDRLAKTLVSRMRQDEHYVALHLRYEKDMLAFTGCTFGLSLDEAEELKQMRYEVKHWREKEIDADEKRRQGGCPLTPRETALLLKGLGYPCTTRIYIAAGEIYGNGSMDFLKREFPNVYSHSTLATQEELRPFSKFQNQLAALDHIVALESDMFLYTYDGNMAKAVEGQRRFEDFRKTIIPDRALVTLLVDSLDAGNISWEEFKFRVNEAHVERTGHPSPRKPGEIPKLEDNFYANPMPGCICEEKPNRKFLKNIM